MPSVPFAICDAFTDTAFGGSPAGIAPGTEAIGCGLSENESRSVLAGNFQRGTQATGA